MKLWIMVAVYFVKVCVQQVPPPDANVNNNAGLRWPVFSWVILSKNLVDFILLLTLDKGVTPCSRGKTGRSGSGSGQVNRVCGSNGSRVKTGHF